MHEEIFTTRNEEKIIKEKEKYGEKPGEGKFYWPCQERGKWTQGVKRSTVLIIDQVRKHRRVHKYNTKQN